MCGAKLGRLVKTLVMPKEFNYLINANKVAILIQCEREK